MAEAVQALCRTAALSAQCVPLLVVSLMLPLAIRISFQ
jgi:hypothetical protein